MKKIIDKKIPRTRRSTLFVLLFASWLLNLTSCEQNIEPVVTPTTEVNFFAHSQVLGTFGTTFSSRYDLPILIDTDEKVNGAIDRTILTHPYLRFNQGSPVYNFPSVNAPSAMPETAVYYWRLEAGRRKLTFMCDTIPLNTKVIEQNFAGGSHHLFYLTDSLRADKTAGFKVFGIPETRQAEYPDQLNYRFINLSPDAGKLTLRFKKTDGSYADSGVETDYGNYTSYTAVDTTGLVTSGGQLIFDVLNEVEEVLFTQRVNAVTNAGYHFVIGGFANAQQGIQYPYALDGAGQPLYRSANISAALALTVRRIY